MSMKRERDLEIKKLYNKYNLGPIPESPFANDVAMNLTNRIKARLSDLENDLQEKKVLFLPFGLLLMYIFTNPSQKLEILRYTLYPAPFSLYFWSFDLASYWKTVDMKPIRSWSLYFF